MKKLLLASLVSSVAFTANATVGGSIVTFDDSSFNGTPGSEVVFDFIDFDADIADVTQTDTDGNSLVTGAEEFSEMGSTDIVNFSLGGNLLGVDSAYEVFYNYNFTGIANNDGTEINVSFDGGTSGLFVDTNKNGSFDLGSATQIASFGVKNGGCVIDIANPIPALNNKGYCALDLSINFVAGYFYNQAGNELSAHNSNKNASLIVTVQDIIGLSPVYNNAGDSQQFQISHDGNMIFDVPEPTSIAILGLGLLGLAGARRRA